MLSYIGNFFNMYNIKDFWKFNKDGASEFEVKKNII